jgi:hypothetical protein
LCSYGVCPLSLDRYLRFLVEPEDVTFMQFREFDRKASPSPSSVSAAGLASMN